MMRLEAFNAIAALNANAIASEKLGAKRVYYCQRCLNHNRLEPRKNHKCECVYANCACHKCILVEKRRVLNTQLHELEEVVEAENEMDNDDGFGLVTRSKGERVPNCQKCGQHGRKSRLKGHKRVCPYRDCNCAKCQVVSERQKLMADQIKIRRRQRKDTLLNITRDNIMATLNAAAAAVAASAPLPYFPNINALIYKQLQENMCNPMSMLANNLQQANNRETSGFESYSNYLAAGDNGGGGGLGLSLLSSDNHSNGLASGAEKLTLNLGAATQQHQQQQQQQQQQSSPNLPHLQFLFQQRQTPPSVTLLNTDRMSVSTNGSSGSSPSSLDEPCSPPIVIPVPINPLISALNSGTIPSIHGNTQHHLGLAPQTISTSPNQAHLGLTIQQNGVVSMANAMQQQQHQVSSNLSTGTQCMTSLTGNTQQQQQQQLTAMDTEILSPTSSIRNNSFPNGGLSAFLENEQIFQALLNNMRLLEQKMMIAESAKSEPEMPTNAFIDVCTM